MIPRTSLLTLLVPLALSWPSPARAQVSDAERAAARELFHAGDELQRAGHFTEALDKFQRAQQVFHAPTNLLRIAECDAALGRLVESAEAYREVARTTLAPDAPPAFQAAVAQARAELGQVEPRVPRMVVEVQPAAPAGAQFVIDGQTVSGALIGEPLPLDPGPHKIAIRAPGYAGVEESVTLAEHETRTLTVSLKPLPPSAAPPPPLAPVGAPPPAPPPLPGAPQVAPAPAPQPGPPQESPPPLVLPERRSTRGFLVGAHLGGLFAGGTLPASSLPIPASGSSVQASSVAQGGFAYGLDGGLRFARQVYVGLDLEHAGMGKGNPGNLGAGVDAVSSNSTSLTAVLGFIVDPDRPSFYVDLTAGFRWFHISETSAAGPKSTTLDSGELGLGAGVWIPTGRNFRVLPKASLTTGAFNGESGSPSAGHIFVMVGIDGFFMSDF